MLVTKQSFHMPELRLENGALLKNVRVGYETYGHLNATGDNAILIAHYYSGTSHAAGRYRESDPEPGYWEALIGPGKAIDTNRFFVLSSDTLCNVSAKSPDVITTGPASLNPDTGKPYGASFPIVTIGDFVNVQKSLCDSLGITKLFAVGGPSMGALQSLEWTARYPEFVSRAICAIPASLSTDPYLIAMVDSWCAPILLDPEFRGGDYYDGPGPVAGLTQSLKLVTLTAVHPGWARRLFKRRWADPERDPKLSLDNVFSVQAALQTTAAERAQVADANSFLRIARAVQLFSVVERKNRLRAKYLFIPAVSDLVMDASYTQIAVKELRELGLSVSVFEIQGDGGHLDGLNLIGQAADAVREFLAAP